MKHLLVFILTLLCLDISAQGYTEADLIGEFEFLEGNEYFDCPVEIRFKDDGTCIYTDRTGTLHGIGYVMGNGGERLHIFAKNDYQGFERFLMINLCVRFVGEADGAYLLQLSSYDKKSWSVTLRRKSSPSAIRGTESQQEDISPAYTLSGVKTQHPTGLYIQSGAVRSGR